MVTFIVGLLVYAVWIAILYGIGRLITQLSKGSVDVVVGIIFFWAMLLGPVLILDNGDYWSRLGLAGLLPFFLIYEAGYELLRLF